DRLLAHLLARCRVEQWRRRLLDHFLIAALDRTFALAEIDDVAMLVAQHLNFDMARVGYEFFHENTFVAKRRLRFRAGAGEAFRNFSLAAGDAHTLAAAARARLDHDRITDVLGDPVRLDGDLDHPEMAWYGRHLGGRSRLLGFNLVAHGGDGFWIWADENNAGCRQGLWKSFTLGQEPVAGMYGCGAALLAGGDDFLDHQVTFGRRWSADGDGRVRHLHVQGIFIGFR